MPLRAVVTILLAVAIPIIASDARAQSVAEFYTGKQVQMLIGSGPGAGFDAYARLVARHLGKHIPGHPTVVPMNKPGAGSLTMANGLVNVGPKDGSAIGAPQSSAPVEGLLHLLSRGGTAAKYDATRLHWIGSASQDVFVLFDWHTAKLKSFSDLMTMRDAAGIVRSQHRRLADRMALNKLLGTKIKLVTGYSVSSAEMLAMERGELDGNAMAYASVSTMRPDWIKDGKIRFLAQMGMTPHPDLKGCRSCSIW